MLDIERLRASCREVLERHQDLRPLDLPCAICHQTFCEQNNAMEHYRIVHGISTTHFDDVADLSGFFSQLRSLLFPADEKTLHCPVCGARCGDESGFHAHVQQSGHSHWNSECISTLSPFCVFPVCVREEGGDEAFTGDKGEVDEISDEALEVESSENGWEEEEEPVLCLFCDVASLDCLSHMRETHSFDFITAIRNRKDVRDVYDVIRVVNIIRWCVTNNTCPYHYKDSERDPEACKDEIGSSSLLSHLKAHPEHAIPRTVPNGDSELIPRIIGDTFISSIVMGNEVELVGDGGTGGEQDYPMVPTIVEIAKKHANEVIN
uniref:WGS project CAEQ00000000 data, annotated contig 934 n=1 Tax=Trypanosoma congolense (strain IL3000) TaxID=1068625 RepID=F9WJP3_TRYCI|nr:unnamed protein product [Trypanosoma congolense IL3000]